MAATVSSENTERLLKEGLFCFPGAVCLWGDLTEKPLAAKAGFLGLSRHKLPVEFSSVYDLASLTKVLATANLAMLARQRGLLDLDAPLSLFFPETAWPGQWRPLTARLLLAHQSGLPAWAPFYLLKAPVEQRRARLLEEILKAAPLAAPGENTVYSDLGFLLLGLVLEKIFQGGLGEIFDREIKKPLKLKDLRFNPLEAGLDPARLAISEDGPRKGGPLNDPRSAVLPAVPLGRVHDDNAAWLGGQAGQAGLFGPAEDLWQIMAAWQKALSGRESLFSQEVLREFIRPHPARNDPGRALGFDLKSPGGSLEGSSFSQATVGHLGYTGTSLWWDWPKAYGWILLTNRVHPTARNEGLKDFRQIMARHLKP